VAQRPRREPQIPEAPAALDETGEALSALVVEIISKKFEVEVGAAVDEVTVVVKPEDIPDLCLLARDDPRLDFNYLRCLSVVDYNDRLEVNYHLFSLDKRHKMAVKTNLPPEGPEVGSVVDLWAGADWYERESRDLFGVTFTGHPNLVPLLLYEGFEGYPGRKSFPFHEYEEW
jgi:NADH:ubiquinone oxidoreductase subunit C|tara:strand:+ start:1009 stop:1527 length:519 start_codon:yes stop_codon:yes gene_type:complete